MIARFQFNLRTLLLLVLAAAIYAFIAKSIHEDYSLIMTPAERRYRERAMEAARKEAVQRFNNRDATQP